MVVPETLLAAGPLGREVTKRQLWTEKSNEMILM